MAKMQRRLNMFFTPEKVRASFVTKLFQTIKWVWLIGRSEKQDRAAGCQVRLVQSTEQASMTAAVEPWHALSELRANAAGAKEAYDAIIDPASSVLKIKPGRTMTNSKKHLRNWTGRWSAPSTWSWLHKRCTDAFRKPNDHVLGPRVADLRSGDAERLP